MLHEELTENIIGAAIEVHKALGPGLLESAYEACLCHELSLRNLKFVRQKKIAIQYKGVLLDCAYFLDLIVEDKVLLELKSIEGIHPVHEAQLLTYMRLTKLPIGFLMNFNVPVLKDGLVRRVL
ncbi:MAG: GxxExxY protein [Planctomycetes bacterium]|nr:GxxExxY protein [Planctomycetota bacterium]